MKPMYVTSGPATGTPVAYVFFLDNFSYISVTVQTRQQLSPAVSAIPHDPMFRPLYLHNY